MHCLEKLARIAYNLQSRKIILFNQYLKLDKIGEKAPEVRDLLWANFIWLIRLLTRPLSVKPFAARVNY